jgi:isocitrate dehydrogenase
VVGKVRVALARGDGIGPEIVDAAIALFNAAGVLRRVEFVPVEMGRRVFDAGDRRGMTDETMRVVESCGLLLKGPMETLKGSGGVSVNVTARKLWSAFANLRHFQALPGVRTVYSRAGVPIDFYVVRENIEDTYAGIEHRLSPDVVQCKRLISAPGSDQVHRFAFETARRLGFDLVHCGHKANIMKMTDGLFLDRFRAIESQYPGVRGQDVLIDALCMGLVQQPDRYRLIVLPNLQGDIVSDLAAGLVGGLGFAPSANIGDHVAIFEAVHGTAPDIAGRGAANPIAVILSGLMLLRHIGLLHLAAVIENALLTALEDGVRTADFGDSSVAPVGTMDLAREAARRLGSAPRSAPAVPVPPDAPAAFQPPPRPGAPRLLETFGDVPDELVGCDIQVVSRLAPAELAASLERACAGSPLRLVLISSRGTQLWPAGSVFTERVDSCRARFERRDGARVDQPQVLALAARIAQDFTVSEVLMLRTWGGARGYSLAQGQ